VTLPDLPTVFEQVVETGATVAPYAGLFAAGVALQRFFNLFGFIAALFTTKKAKLDEVVEGVRELIDDVKGGRLDEVLSGIAETMKDLKELLAKQQTELAKLKATKDAG
jgi:hypothetical protein